MNQADIHQFIQQAPKVELHLHLEGTLEPAMMLELAKKNQISLPYGSINEIKNAYQFKNLQSFLDIYYKGTDVLVQEQDFFDLTWAYLNTAANENIRHVEISFDPQTHTRRGVPFSTVISGIHRALKEGEKELNITSRLIMCFLRHLSEDEAMKTLDQSLEFKEVITAVGLDSSEKGNPPGKFQKIFEKALNQGFLTVAHAGEEGPPEYITEALDLLKVSRIDHGVACLKDPDVVQRLVDEKIPLTVCPLSNVKLHIFDNLEEHNLKDLIQAGLRVTINSDDPSYFGGYLTENFIQTQRALNLTSKEIRTLIIDSVEASFLKPEVKQNHIKSILTIFDSYFGHT